MPDIRILHKKEPQISHVYIIGAGFSVPLGGPLFTELLTTKLERHRRKCEIEQPYGVVVSRICERFNAVSPIEREAVRFFARLGPDAESLLEKVETLSESCDKSISDQIKEVMFANGWPIHGEQDTQKYMKGLNRILRRLIAYECEEFLNELDEKSDRWDPYKSWIKNSFPNHIISFNYDTAIERVARLVDKEVRLAGAEARVAGAILKLHGSVNEIVTNNSIKIQESAYTDPNVDLAICTPGLMKSTAESTIHDFRCRWSEARNWLSRCHRLSIVGYSMPATDNKARMTILDAIAKNKNIERVDLVLGPSSRSIVATRMSTIIKSIAGQRVEVIDHPLYAQDFLPYVEKF